MSGLNIVFAGTPEFGLPSLDALAQSEHHILAVYTQPDRPAGRGRALQASAIKLWALEREIPVYQPLNFKNHEVVEELSALNPDVLVVIAYGLILPKSVLSIPRLGCVNVHASLLPAWRGASPIQAAILHGDSHSGVTIMQMDVGMDTGDMLSIASCSITEQDTAETLHDRLALLAVEPLLNSLNDLAIGRAIAQPQNNALATYAGKIQKEQACINWQDSAVKIAQQIRAFNPWPIAFCTLGEEVVRIYQAVPVPYSSNHAPGTVVRIDKQGMLIATGDDGLLVGQIQFPGGKRLSIADWLNSGKKTLHTGLLLG